MHASTALGLLLVRAVQLTWSAPEGCPSADTLQQQLAPELAGEAAATVIATADAFRLELTVNGAARTLETPTCDEAAKAAVFFIRVGLQQPEPVAVAAPAAPPPAPVVEAVPWTVGASALAGVGLFGLPRPLPRFGGALRVQRGPWAATLEATTSLAARFTGGPTATSGATLREPLDAQLGACRLFALGPFALGPCLHVAVTWLSATGDEVSQPRQTSIALWAAGPGARVYLTAVSWLELFVSAVARFGSRPSVFFSGSEPFVQGGPLSLELSAGAGARF